MRVGIIGHYGFNNLGDELNLREMLRLIERQRPGTDVTVHSPALWHCFAGVPYRLTGASSVRGQLEAQLDSYDALVVGGGGLIHLGHFFFDYLEAARTPVVFCRVGIDDREVAAAACDRHKRLLSRAASFTVRTEGDRALAERHLGLSPEVVPDPIWCCRFDPYPMPRGRPPVAVSINVHGARHIDAVRAALHHLPRPARECTVSMEDTTIDTYYNVAATNHGNRLVIPDSLGLDGKAAVLAAADLVVTSRLHAALLAMSHGVPAMMLASTPKVRFLAEQLGVPDWHYAHGITSAEMERLMSLKQVEGPRLAATGQELAARAETAKILP